LDYRNFTTHVVQVEQMKLVYQKQKGQ
jgi:hypothetical protein